MADMSWFFPRWTRAISLRIKGKTIKQDRARKRTQEPGAVTSFTIDSVSPLLRTLLIINGPVANRIKSGVNSSQNAQRFQIYQYQTVVIGLTIIEPDQKMRCPVVDFGVLDECPIAQIQKKENAKAETRKRIWNGVMIAGRWNMEEFGNTI